MPRVAILGAGISGLATALYLKDRAGELPGGLEVVILDAGERVGGNIQTDRVDGFTVEKGPNGYLDNVVETPKLVRRLGLEGELQKADDAAAKRYLYRFGRLYELPTGPLSFLTCGVLTLRGRLRVMMEPFARARPEGKEETVFEFASRRIGVEAASVLVDAMVSGVFAGNARELSLPSTFPKMAAMEAEHGGLVRAMLAKARARKAARRRGEEIDAGGPAGPGGTLTSFRNGLDTLPRRLVEELGDVVRLRSEVAEIRRHDGDGPPWRIAVRDADPVAADALVVTFPSPRAAPVLEGFDEALAAAVRQIPTAGLAVVALAYDAAAIGGAPEGFGFLVPRGTGARILGCLWDSSVFPGRAPEGKVLVRAMIGGAHDPGAVGMPEDAMVRAVRQDLVATMGLSGEPLWTRLYRWPLGIGQYRVGHQGVLDRIHERLAKHPGLWVAGSSYYGVAMNACIERAVVQGEEILRSLGA